jgi:beta-glucosidase
MNKGDAVLDISKQELAKRVDDFLGRMTVEEKIDYIGGHREFYIRPMPRLGLPEIKMSDGPVGCRNYGPTTAYPTTVALAATWNPALALAMGKALGRDCRARGVHILLAPGVNIFRSPLCGRNFEYLGEDPFLTSTMVVPIIEGIQSQEVLATVKHFVANNQEYDRHHVSSEIDERTLQEIYLPAFRAAVKKGKVACVMNAYNLLNGIHCSEHDWLLNKTLKGAWGFDGILMSDWASTYSAVGAANGGLDLEMPFAKWMNRELLLPAIKDGSVKMATIDDKVRRILRTIIRAGFLERPQTDPAIGLYDPANVRAALDVAREAVVLLKNERSVLPLDRKQIRKLGVIGPNAHPAVHGGGGSAYTTPLRVVSVLDGLVAAAGDGVEVHYDRGVIAEDLNPMFGDSAFSCQGPDGAACEGLRGEYFASSDFTGAPVTTRVDRQVNFNWGPQRPNWLPPAGFSVRWTGQITPAKSGEYMLVGRCDDGMRVWLDGELVIDDWSQHAARISATQRRLEADRRYNLKIEYYDVGGECAAQFGWGLAAEPAEASAIRLAKAMDAVVVCVGFDQKTEGEGSDRRFELTEPQQRLLAALAGVNPNTIVVLFGGGGMATAGWIDQVPALLHAWYPGQEGGRAIAEVIFGAVNPSGKLPMTFERRLEDNPSTPHYPATDKKTFYKEGIFVGYRGFDRAGVEPLFAFGHGLSYTTFEYGHLAVAPEAVAAKGKLKLTFELANTGPRAGAEVAQVYVGRVGESAVQRPLRELKGFKKVFLGKGRKKTVAITIPAADLAYYDAATKTWIVEPGRYEISVGASSRDVRLKAQVQVTA